jgi:hypothetical protein
LSRGGRGGGDGCGPNPALDGGKTEDCKPKPVGVGEPCEGNSTECTPGGPEKKPKGGGDDHNHDHNNHHEAKSGKGLKQMASAETDDPDDNPNAVEVHTTTAKKDILGDYHIKGEIKNLGKEALQYVKVTGHFYDSNNQIVGITSCCYTDPTEIEPGHTATFDSFAEKDEFSGKPETYKLSYDWD